MQVPEIAYKYGIALLLGSVLGLGGSSALDLSAGPDGGLEVATTPVAQECPADWRARVDQRLGELSRSVQELSEAVAVLTDRSDARLGSSGP